MTTTFLELGAANEETELEKVLTVFCKSDAYASLSRFSHVSRVFRAGAHFSALEHSRL